MLLGLVCLLERLVGFELGRSSLGDGVDRFDRDGGLAAVILDFSCTTGCVGAAFDGESPSNTIPRALSLSMTPSGYVIEIFCPHSMH